MNKINFFKKSIVSLIVFLVLTSNFLVFGQNTAAGTEVSNIAEASYKNDEGQGFNTVSPTVKFIVKAISAVVVTPDETDPQAVVAANEMITQKFRVCNSSNTADSYTISNTTITSPSQIIALYYDIDNNEQISNADLPISLNSTQSPVLAPGACLNVLIDINTRDIQINQLLVTTITAKSTLTDSANGLAEDSGKIISTTGKNAVLGNPSDPTLVPLKTVENQSTYVSAKNQPLNYSISFKNHGDVPAKSVILTDDLPVQLSYIANTLRLNGNLQTDTVDTDQGSVTGSHLEVKLDQPLAPGGLVTVTFQAMIVASEVSGQGIVNVAKIVGKNTPPVETSQAITVIDPFGIVYAARGGSGSPISGASVLISTDPIGVSPLSIPENQGFEPNLGNSNPYQANSQGRYSFAMRPDQLGTASQPAVYYMNVSAPNFRSRLIQITLVPNGNGLFKMTVHSLDGLPLAVAGGFTLVAEDVDINSIADIAFNIPMFESSTLEITKTVDRIQAEIGDILTYHVDVHNAAVAPILDVVVNDTLPDSFNYVEGSAEIVRGNSTTPIVPIHDSRVLQFRLGTVPSGERISITYRVRIGVNITPGQNYNQAVSSGVFNSGEVVQTGVVKSGVRVSPGVFSMKQVIIGRVFIDDNGDNLFENGERPVVGARIYLSNGEAAITDSQGMYNIPAVSEGAQVIAIDPITLPAGFMLQDNNVYAGKSWTRLLRTPLGGGALLRQNFALVASKDNPQNVSQPTEAEKPAETSENQPSSQGIKTKDLLNDVQNVNAGYNKNSDTAPNEVRPVAEGDVQVLSYADNSVVMAPAANLEITVAQNWKVQLELEGKSIDKNNIGTTRDDRKNKIVSYTFIGLGMKPGPNKLVATAVGPDGQPGKTVSMTLYGRGSAKTIEIIPDNRELHSSGRDATKLLIRAFDAWKNPALDLPVMVETTAGRLIGTEETDSNQQAAKANRVLISQNAQKTAGVTSEQQNAVGQQYQVTLKDGIGMVKLISDTKIGLAKIKATTGSAIAETQVQFISEERPGMLVSLAEVTVGKSAPDMQNRGVDENVRSHVQFFYRGGLFTSKNMLTLAYDSQQPLNRVSGKDRLFQLNPLDRVYPIFGDNSTRFQETESNSKVYARLDNGRSYGMFGDFSADMEQSRLTGYNRKLTGVKLHLENSNGDFVTATGARPDTSFAREVIPGGTLGIVQLSYPDIMPGTEFLVIETRDRRSPDVILTRETLARGVDYNMDSSSGTIFFLRPIQAFDRNLNLVQVVATYEYRSNGMESSVYTARANKNIKSLGLRFGGSYLNQKQTNSSPYQMGGLDISVNTPNRGKLDAEFAVSKGSLNNGFSFFGNSPNGNNHDGNAFYVHYNQPLDVMRSTLQFEGSKASEGFYNPFGASVTPGNTRGNLTWDARPIKNGSLKVNLAAEKNNTENVDNSRVTAGAHWTQTINEKVKFDIGYDHRQFSDYKNVKNVSSNLVTLGAEFKPNDKMTFAVKREQNLGDADPSYPDQTTLQADYRVNGWAKVFFTQRFANAMITPISDTVGTGFSFSKARNETAVGVESQFGKFTSMSGRYQLENGINGTDSFAIVGLQNRLPVNKHFSVDLGVERAFHIAGDGKSYTNFLVGANYLPNDHFRSSFRYELRDRDGLGQVFSFGSAGELRPGWTMLGRYQYGNISFENRKNKVSDGELAMAIRPHDSDKYGLLFAYTHRDSFMSNGDLSAPTQFKADVLSADGFQQTTKRLELYGRFALKINGDGNSNQSFADSLTYMAQGRAQYQLTRYFDVAAEGRYLYQPASKSQKQWVGVEGGWWVMPDLRLGVGYNFTRSQEAYGFSNNNIFNKNGFYFVISSKLARLFNLFGTKNDGLNYVDNEPATPTPQK